MTGSSHSLTKSKRIPGYLLHKPTGQARVRIDGKDHYLGPFGSQESRIKYGELIAQIGMPKQRDPLTGTDSNPGVTIAGLVLAYTEYAKSYYVKRGKVTHEVSCIECALRPLVALYGPQKANDFGALKLKAVRQAMIDVGGNCRKFINQCIGRIRRMFRWGVSNEMIDSQLLAKLDSVEPLKAGRTEAIEHEPRSIVPQADLDKVMARVTQRVADLMRLQLLTGARPGELVMLTWKMIDKRKHAAHGVWVAELDDHKMVHKNQKRFLVFGAKAQEILLRHKTAKSDERIFKIQRTGYNLAVRRACMALNIKRFTPHWLRHNFATITRNEEDLETAQELLGHADSATTEIYAHVDLTRAIAWASQKG